MASLFYQRRYGRHLVLPLLAYERAFALFKDITEAELEPDALHDAVAGALVTVLRECCGVPNPTPDDIRQFDEKLQAALKDDKAPSDPDKPPPKKSLGTSFQAAILEKIPITDLLLQMCRYDYARAEFYYAQVDRDDVLEMVNSYLLRVIEEHTYQFEAVLYGMGGHYAEDDKPADDANTTTVDNPADFFKMMNG
jgi:hypothetical protein